MSKLNMEIELTRRRLREADAQVAVNGHRLTQLETQEENLRAELKVEKLKGYFLMEKAFSCASPQSHPSVEVYVESVVTMCVCDYSIRAN